MAADALREEMFPLRSMSTVVSPGSGRASSIAARFSRTKTRGRNDRYGPPRRCLLPNPALSLQVRVTAIIGDQCSLDPGVVPCSRRAAGAAAADTRGDIIVLCLDLSRPDPGCTICGHPIGCKPAGNDRIRAGCRLPDHGGARPRPAGLDLEADIR